MRTFVVFMTTLRTITTTTYLFLCFTVSFAEENLFMKMAEKRYAAYSQELYDEYVNFEKLDTIEAQKVIDQLKEVAQKTGSKEWKLQVSYFELELFRKRYLVNGDNWIALEELLNRALLLLELTEKESVLPLELMVRQRIVDYYWNDFKNYELAFSHYKTQEERLKRACPDEIPERADYFIQMANAYYFFKDYTQAIVYFNRVIEEENTIRTHNPKHHARNGLGLSYRYGSKDLNRSDSCFFSIIQRNSLGDYDQKYCEMWDGIALGNIGHNMILRGEYDQATPLLKNSLDIALGLGDHGYAAGRANDLADIYLRKGAIPEAKYHIDLARRCYGLTPRYGVLPRIYEMLSKYYAAIGDTKLSISYVDSLLHASKQYEEEFNAMLLLRMEQKELANQQNELAREKEIRRQIQLHLLVISTGFMLISILSVLLFVFYRRKQVAYRQLVRKSQEWAKEAKTMAAGDKNSDAERLVSDVDRQLFTQLQQLFQSEHLYRDTDLTIDKVALRMKVNKNYLSRAVNRCTGKNFNAFVNEYRIQEAVLMISDGTPKNSFERVAYDVGFNDRKTFYTAFCKTTGLSPSAFRNNLKK